SVGYARTSGVNGDTCDFICGSLDFIKEGVILGGRVGNNVKYGNSLFGLEADFNWLDGDRTETLCRTCFSFGIISVNRDFLGSARVRSGLVVDRTLVYVTAGIAFSDGEHSVQLLNNNNAGPVQTQEFDWGWVAGFGVEH